jgi:hypothetical protein
MWSKQLKEMVIQLKDNALIRERFLKNPEDKDFSFLSRQEKAALVKAYSGPVLSSISSPLGYWA